MKWELDATFSKTEKIDFLEEFGLHFYIKRDDQIHPLISGNKSRKLKYYIREFNQKNHDGIITFGGAFSNHLLAVAQACFDLKIPCLGIVRGDEINKESNQILTICFQKNMDLTFIERSLFDKIKNETEFNHFFDFLKNDFSFNYPIIIPEGANTKLGSKGMEDILKQLDFSPDYFITSVGTGATFLGLEKSFQSFETNVIGIAAMKKDRKLENLEAFLSEKLFFTSYAFGDFDISIINFIVDFFQKYQIILDPIYTAKSLLKIKELAEQNYFRPQSNIVFLHTGGITGLFSKKSLELLEKHQNANNLLEILKGNYGEFFI